MIAVLFIVLVHALHDWQIASAAAGIPAGAPAWLLGSGNAGAGAIAGFALQVAVIAWVHSAVDAHTGSDANVLWGWQESILSWHLFYEWFNEHTLMALKAGQVL